MTAPNWGAVHHAVHVLLDALLQDGSHPSFDVRLLLLRELVLSPWHMLGGAWLVRCLAALDDLQDLAAVALLPFVFRGLLLELLAPFGEPWAELLGSVEGFGGAGYLLVRELVFMNE